MKNQHRKNNNYLQQWFYKIWALGLWKIGFVLGNISEKIKNWEGFPQTSQSHKTLVVMRHNDGHKNYGSTEDRISVDSLTTFNSIMQFFCFLLSSPHFGFDQPDLAIANLAHLLLPSGQAHASAKSKELNFLTRKIIVLNKFFDYFLGNKNKSSKTLAFFTFASFNSYNP